MKESFQNREINKEARHKVKETGERTISRREFLKLLGATGALLASQGFHGSASAEGVFLKKEQTEFISLRASPEKQYKRGTLRSYAGGTTLSAYVIARLVDEQAFTRSYLKKDPALLARAMDEKIGRGAALALTEPINLQASFYEKGSLDILHNIFKHENKFDLLRVKEILHDAWEKEGMEELVEYKTDGDVKMTMNLFPILDESTGQQSFSVTAAAEGPQVTRFKKDSFRRFSQEGITVELPRHHVSVVIRQALMSKKGRKENIRFAAEQLQNTLWDEDPNHYGNQPLLILGIPDEITNAPSVPTFQEQWIVIQNILKNYITAALKEVYEQAGVTEEQYIPYAFSPLSSAE